MSDFTIQKLNELRSYPLSYRLQKLRCQMGYTQKEFSKLIGCTQSSVSMWESGICIPNGRTLEKIIRLYNLPYDFFIDVDIQKAKLCKKS